MAQKQNNELRFNDLIVEGAAGFFGEPRSRIGELVFHYANRAPFEEGVISDEVCGGDGHLALLPLGLVALQRLLVGFGLVLGAFDARGLGALRCVY